MATVYLAHDLKHDRDVAITVRTRFMLGPYPARQASANFAPSTVNPFRLANSSTSLVTDVRQSTTVPKVSKTSALTDPSWAFDRVLL